MDEAQGVSGLPPSSEVDDTLIEESLRMSLRARLEQNDRLLRALEKLEQGFALVRSQHDPR